jgi:hypothetical protein
MRWRAGFLGRGVAHVEVRRVQTFVPFHLRGQAASEHAFFAFAAFDHALHGFESAVVHRVAAADSHHQRFPDLAAGRDPATLRWFCGVERSGSSSGS